MKDQVPLAAIICPNLLKYVVQISIVNALELYIKDDPTLFYCNDYML